MNIYMLNGKMKEFNAEKWLIGHRLKMELNI